MKFLLYIKCFYKMEFNIELTKLYTTISTYRKRGIWPFTSYFNRESKLGSDGINNNLVKWNIKRAPKRIFDIKNKKVIELYDNNIWNKINRNPYATVSHVWGNTILYCKNQLGIEGIS